MVLKPIKGPFGTFGDDLLARVESVFAGENLLQVTLHAHLLLERALHYKIGEKLVCPDVLASNPFARLSFAQKVAMFVGLYDPKPDTERLLLAFNRLRNAIAHEITDLDSAVKQHLAPALQACIQDGDSQLSTPEDPIDVVRVVFGYPALFDLGALHGFTELTKKRRAKRIQTRTNAKPHNIGVEPTRKTTWLTPAVGP